MLADFGHWSVAGQRNGCGINVALVATVTAVDPQQLVLADEIAERDGASGLGLFLSRCSVQGFEAPQDGMSFREHRA